MITSRVASAVWTRWLRWGMGVAHISPSASVDFGTDITELRRGQVSIGKATHIAKGCWLNAATAVAHQSPVIQVGDHVSIGRYNVISAKNSVMIGAYVLTAPHVLIMDHAHEFRNVDLPIMLQGITEGGRIVIGEGCWIGFGAAIICNRGSLTIGRNSVIGANSVVTGNVEPFTVVAGSPAKVIRAYDVTTRTWSTSRQPAINVSEGANEI